MNIHRELIAHIDHDMNIFGEINHLRRHIALQIGKTINDLANRFFCFQNLQ